MKVVLYSVRSAIRIDRGAVLRGGRLHRGFGTMVMGVLNEGEGGDKGCGIPVWGVLLRVQVLLKWADCAI